MNSDKSPPVQRATPAHDSSASGKRSIRMLRLPQVIDATGLGKTKIYELEEQGDFPCA